MFNLWQIITHAHSRNTFLSAVGLQSMSSTSAHFVKLHVN